MLMSVISRWVTNRNFLFPSQLRRILPLRDIFCALKTLDEALDEIKRLQEQLSRRIQVVSESKAVEQEGMQGGVPSSRRISWKTDWEERWQGRFICWRWWAGTGAVVFFKGKRWGWRMSSYLISQSEVVFLKRSYVYVVWMTEKNTFIVDV